MTSPGSHDERFDQDPRPAPPTISTSRRSALHRHSRRDEARHRAAHSDSNGSQRIPQRPRIGRHFVVLFPNSASTLLIERLKRLWRLFAAMNSVAIEPHARFSEANADAKARNQRRSGFCARYSRRSTIHAFWGLESTRRTRRSGTSLPGFPSATPGQARSVAEHEHL